MLITEKLISGRGEDSFGGVWSLYNFGGPLYEKQYKITTTNLGKKVNIYLGLLPEPLKGPVPLTGHEDSASFPARAIHPWSHGNMAFMT